MRTEIGPINIKVSERAAAEYTHIRDNGEMYVQWASERGVFHMEFGENALLSHTMAAQIMMEEDSG